MPKCVFDPMVLRRDAERELGLRPREWPERPEACELTAEAYHRGVIMLVDRLRTFALVSHERDRLRASIKHVVNDSPGTPDSVKKYLLRALEGSWGEPYEQAMTHSRPEGGA